MSGIKNCCYSVKFLNTSFEQCVLVVIVLLMNLDKLVCVVLTKYGLDGQLWLWCCLHHGCTFMWCQGVVILFCLYSIDPHWIQ